MSGEGLLAACLAIVVGFVQNLDVGLPGKVVGGLGGDFFRFASLADLLIPARIDGVAAPLGAALAGADRFAIDFDKNRVGV